MNPKHIQNEKAIVGLMITLYCRHKEGNIELCDECKTLLEYAHKRLDACKFGNDKPTCKNCPVHCYQSQYREQIRRVMRYSGPRMLWYHPKEAVKHLFLQIRTAP